MNGRSHFVLSFLLLSMVLTGLGCTGDDSNLSSEIDAESLIGNSSKSIPTIIFDEYVFIDKNRTDLTFSEREQMKYDYREKLFYIESCKVDHVVDNRKKKNNPNVLVVLDCGIRRKFFYVYLKPKEEYYKQALELESGEEIKFVAKVEHIYDMIEDHVWFNNGIFIEDK